MALRLSVKLKNGKNLPLAYRALRLPFARRAYSRALTRMGKTVQGSSRRNFLSGQVIGVITGELIRSLEVDVSKLPREVSIGSRLPQAGVLHFGSRKKNITARPYLFPAVDKEKRHFPPILLGELERAWNRIAAVGRR